MKRTILISAVGIGLCCGLSAQESIETELRTNGKKTLKVFEPYRQVLQDHSAVIYRGYKRIVYGVIVSPDGYILTKASELDKVVKLPVTPGEEEKNDGKQKPLTVRIGKDVLYEDVKIVARDTGWDVALIKVDANGLKPIEFAESSETKHGSWVMANGATSRSKRRVRVGVVSAKTREIPGPSPVVMGVTLEEKNKKVYVRGIAPKSGAADSDLKKDDVLVKVEGKPVTTRKEIVDIISALEPGYPMSLTYLRDGKEAETKVKLMARPMIRPQRMNKNDSMSGRFSLRRSGFDKVIQVDIPMQESSCGGPVLNLDKKCIGMVIARANRAETFVVPSEELQQLYEKLKGEQD